MGVHIKTGFLWKRTSPLHGFHFRSQVGKAPKDSKEDPKPCSGHLDNPKTCSGRSPTNFLTTIRNPSKIRHLTYFSGNNVLVTTKFATNRHVSKSAGSLLWAPSARVTKSLARRPRCRSFERAPGASSP